VTEQPTACESAQTTAPRLVLASASPRRRGLLYEAGYVFEVHPADIDEDDHPVTLSPGDLAEWLATQKADVISRRYPDAVVLAADTVVAFGESNLGKPEDAGDARRMLELLGGTTHMVVTGVAVVRRLTGFTRTTRVISAVSMRVLTPEEIAAYIASNAWEGKAGGYGIQDDDPFVTRINGSFTNIVGLPMEEIQAMLAEAGVLPTVDPKEKRE
jgi:septum formation protein